jgi:hypothetical protein
MGQDSEEAAEFVATVRADHAAMKAWYHGDSQAASLLRNKFGPYPGLWKEVLNWPGWKEARRDYLKHSQTAEASASGSSNGNGNGNGSNSVEGARKRKSRWGSVAAAAPEGSSDDAAAKRQSRWSSADAPAGPPAAPAVHAPALPLPALLPGLPANLPPEKEQEVRALQSRLREVNDRLQTIDQEAARVEALPRGHRERSPSPPPGKLLPLAPPKSLLLRLFDERAHR